LSHLFKSLFFIFLCFFVKKSTNKALALQKQQFRSFHILVLFHISLDKKHSKKKFCYYFIFLINLFWIKKCKNNYWTLLSTNRFTLFFLLLQTLHSLIIIIVCFFLFF